MRCAPGWEDANDQLPFCQVKEGPGKERMRCEAMGKKITSSGACGGCDNPYLVYRRLSCKPDLPYDAEGMVEGYALFERRKRYVDDQAGSEKTKKKRFPGKRMEARGGRKVEVPPCEAPCSWDSIAKAKTGCDAWEECTGFVDKEGDGSSFLPIFDEDALEVNVHGKEETNQKKTHLLYAKICKGGRDPSSSCKTCKPPLVEKGGECVCPVGLDPAACVDSSPAPSFSGQGACSDRRKKPDENGVCVLQPPFSEGGECSDPNLDPDSNCSACKFDLSLAFPSKEEGGTWCVSSNNTKRADTLRDCLASCGIDDDCEAASFDESGTCKTGHLVRCDDAGGGGGDVYIKRGTPPRLLPDGRCGCPRVDTTLSKQGGVCLLNQKVRGGETFLVFEGPSTFEEARKRATQNGGRLAIVKESASKEALLSAMEEGNVRRAYVGAERRRGGGGWRWADGTPFVEGTTTGGESSAPLPFEGAKMVMANGATEEEDLSLVATLSGGDVVFEAVPKTRKLSFAATTSEPRCSNSDLDPSTGCSSCLSSAFRYDPPSGKCVPREGIHSSWTKPSSPPFQSYIDTVPKEMSYKLLVQRRRKKETERPILGQIPLDSSLEREEVEARCASACSKTEGCEGFLLGKYQDLSVGDDHTCILLRTRAGMEGGGEPKEGVSTYLMQYCNNKKMQFWNNGDSPPCSGFGGKTLFDENGTCEGKFRDKTHCARFSACEKGFEDATVEDNDGSCQSKACLPGVKGKGCDEAEFANTLYETTRDFHDATTCPPDLYAPFSGKDCECAASQEGFHFDPASGCKQPLPTNDVVCEEGWAGANCDVPADACGPYGKVEPESTKTNPVCSFLNGCPDHFDKKDCRRCEDGWGPSPSSSPSKDACSIDTKAVCGTLPVLKIVETKKKADGKEADGKEVYCDCRPKNESTLGHWAGRTCDVCEGGWGGENCDLDASKCHNRGLPGKTGKMDSPDCEGCNMVHTKGGSKKTTKTESSLLHFKTGLGATCGPNDCEEGWYGLRCDVPLSACDVTAGPRTFRLAPTLANSLGEATPSDPRCDCSNGGQNTGLSYVNGKCVCKEGFVLDSSSSTPKCVSASASCGGNGVLTKEGYCWMKFEGEIPDGRCDVMKKKVGTGKWFLDDDFGGTFGVTTLPECESRIADWINYCGGKKTLKVETVLGSKTSPNEYVRQECVCKEGYTGDKCEDCAPGYHKFDGVHCASIKDHCRGRATTVDATGKCICDPPFKGPLCEDCNTEGGFVGVGGVCYDEAINCGSNAKLDPSGKCVCEANGDDFWTGDTTFVKRTATTKTYLKGGNNGTVSCDAYCANDGENWGPKYGVCQAAYQMDDRTVPLTEYATRGSVVGCGVTTPGHNLACFCGEPEDEKASEVQEISRIPNLKKQTREELVAAATKNVCQYHNTPPGQPGETCSGDGTINDEGGCVCNTKAGHPVAAGSNCQFSTATYCGPDSLGATIKLEKRSNGSEDPVGCDCDESVTGKRIREDSWFFVGPKQPLSGCIYHMGDCPGLGYSSLAGQDGTGGFYLWRD